MALAEERKSNQLDLESLTTLIYTHACSYTPLPRIREIREKVRKIPELNLPIERYFDSREQCIQRAQVFGRRWYDFCKAEKLTIEEQKIAFENVSELNAIPSDFFFFLPSLEIQASDEQLREWVPKVHSFEIIGSYSQTELGHGSNVRGVEIEAIYDHSTSSFIINSPTVSATKWWIGGLGINSNHTLLVAQLVINGQKYGPHPFLVPLRDVETHVPFVGVDVGDIGPKIGLHIHDNGYLRFTNYRIPKKYMLTRFTKINDKGEYEVLDPNSLKVLYMSVVRARLGIITDHWMSLSIALTISIRYSIVRVQFTDPENSEKEVKLLDYQIQQYKLLVQLSQLYAFVFSRVPLINVYVEAENSIKAGKAPPMDYLHGLMCLYKIFIASKGTESLEMCRRSCGGHGYLMNSGLGCLYNEYLAKVTYDGENTVLGLQVIKYLISLFHKIPPQDFLYLTKPPVVPHGESVSFDFHQQAFESIAHFRVNNVNKKYNSLRTRYSKDKILADFIQVEGFESLEPVFLAHVHSNYGRALLSVREGINKLALEHLRRVFVGSELQKYYGDLLMIGLPATKIDDLKEMLIESLSFTRKHALSLIEAFERNDESLNSVLGRSDGEVYEHLYKFAKDLNPLNKTKVFPGITDYLRPKI